MRTRTRQRNFNVLRDHAVFEQYDAIRQSDRFFNVVCDQESGEALFQPEPFEQLLHLNASQRVKRAERFIQ